MDRDTNNQLLVTVRSGQAREFAEAQSEQHPDRINIASIDWGEESAADSLRAAIQSSVGSDLAVSGVVHAIASVPKENFALPAHEIPVSAYLESFHLTALSLVEVVRGAKDNMRSSGGVVTFNFGQHRRIQTEYGPALSVAKNALSDIVAHMAGSLGHVEPPARVARVAEIVTGFIPTNAAKWVVLGMNRKRGSGNRVPIEAFGEGFSESSALSTADPDEQRKNAGLVAIEFIDGTQWSQTTGQRFEVDAGWSLLGRNIAPDRPRSIVDKMIDG